MQRLLSLWLLLPALAWANGPSFDCARAGLSSIETLVCHDPGLSALDRQLASVYRAAVAKAEPRQLKWLKAEQRGWVKGRNDCWKADDHAACAQQAYVEQIVSLQARYRLVELVSQDRLVCGASPADEVRLSYFATSPRTLIAERGDSVSLMIQQPQSQHYLGRNESLTQTADGILLTWGYQAAELHCKPQP